MRLGVKGLNANQGSVAESGTIWTVTSVVLAAAGMISTNSPPASGDTVLISDCP